MRKFLYRIYWEARMCDPVWHDSYIEGRTFEMWYSTTLPKYKKVPVKNSDNAYTIEPVIHFIDME